MKYNKFIPLVSGFLWMLGGAFFGSDMMNPNTVTSISTIIVNLLAIVMTYLSSHEARKELSNA